MIACCPQCDSMFPLTVDLARSMSENLTCPCCETVFTPFMDILDKADMEIEDLKEKMVIKKSLQNLGRWFEDC